MEHGVWRHVAYGISPILTLEDEIIKQTALRYKQAENHVLRLMNAEHQSNEARHSRYRDLQSQLMSPPTPPPSHSQQRQPPTPFPTFQRSTTPQPPMEPAPFPPDFLDPLEQRRVRIEQRRELQRRVIEWFQFEVFQYLPIFGDSPRLMFNAHYVYCKSSCTGLWK